MRSYKLDRKSATQFVAAIDSIFPSIKQYNQDVRYKIHHQGYLESFFGRRRRFGLITDENRSECYRQGANFLVQSMASDINLYCMLHLYNMKAELGARPLFPVHDSIVFDIVGPEVIPQVKKELISYAEGLVDRKVNFGVDLKVGPT